MAKVLALSLLAATASAFMVAPKLSPSVRVASTEETPGEEAPPVAMVEEVVVEEVVEEPVVEEVVTPPVAAAVASAAVLSFESEIGAQPPLGFFDPLGMLDGADQERFDRLRYVEVKHGRICMLAVLGQITTKAGIFLPGTIDYAGTKFSDIPTGIAAIAKVPAAGIAQIVAFIGLLELFVMKDSANGAAPGEFPGDFRNGFIDFGWDSLSEEEKVTKRAIELNNGRAAQMGILALMVHEQLGVSLWPGGI